MLKWAAHIVLGGISVAPTLQLLAGEFVRTEFPFEFAADLDWEQAAAVLAELRELQADVSSRLGLPPPSNVIHIRLFSDRNSYRQFFEQEFPELPYRRALYLMRAGSHYVFAYVSREMITDLRHECVHAILHNALPTVPIWLDEGLAEYFEMPSEQRAFDCPYLRSVRFKAAFGMVPRLEKLEQLDELEEMNRGEYEASWAWVHFCLHGPPQVRQAFRKYIYDLQDDGQLSATLSDRLRAVGRQPEVLFVEHFLHWSR